MFQLMRHLVAAVKPMQIVQRLNNGLKRVIIDDGALSLKLPSTKA